MKIVVVLPAFNEEENIEAALRSLYAINQSWKCVVVDDASEDNTYERARAAGAVVLRHIVNRGQGAALRTGTKWAINHEADIIVHFDADGQFDARELPAFIEPLIEGRTEVVFGSRFLGAHAVEIPWTKRIFILPFARIVNYLLTGVKLSDAHNGLRAFTRASALRIRIVQDRMAHNSNIVAEVRRARLRFVELPITVYYHSYGQRAIAGFHILKDLLFGSFIK